MARKRKYLTVNLLNVSYSIGILLAQGEFEKVDGIKEIIPENYLDLPFIEKTREEYSAYFKKLEEEDKLKEGALS